MRWIFPAILLVLVVASARADAPAERLAGIDAVIERALAEQKIPGAAVGVVVGDRVVLLKGYGRRDVERDAPVTPDTQFQIASITKQFTVAALGTLVRRGKLDWDTPARNYLPDLRLGDDGATLAATPRDLVTHRTGMPRHDFVWYGATLGRDDLYRRLRYLPFSRPIREKFQYNNLMYMTAGYLGGRVNGTDYETLVQAALFEPLGMTRSHFSLQRMTDDPDHATGYQLDNDRNIVPHAFSSTEAMAPTGAILSTARDLTAYVRMMLAGGEFEGKRVLQEADVRAMMQPQVPIRPGMFPEQGFLSYGMGLFVETYRGREIAHHGGNLSGAAAIVMFAPKERIGIVVLTNRSGARLRDGLPYEILDRLLGLPGAGMIDRYAELERKALAGEDAAKSAGVSDRKPGTRPAHALPDYAGRYVHPAYGDLEIRERDGGLALTFHGFAAPLEHWHFEVFKTPSDKTLELDDVRVQFLTDLQGEVSGVAVPIEPLVEPTVFARAAPAEMLDPAFLGQFVGSYDLGGIETRVQLRDDSVLQTVRLGEVRELVPVRGMLFRVKEQAGMSVEFLRDAGGRVDRMAVHAGASVIGPRRPQ